MTWFISTCTAVSKKKENSKGKKEILAGIVVIVD